MASASVRDMPFTAPIMDGERVAGVVVRAPNGTEYQIEANWTLDASGQAAILSRSLGLRQWDDYFQNMAVYSYFDAGERLSAPNSNDIFIESYHDGWAWNIPLRGGASSVGVVVDSEAGRAGIAERGVAGYFARQLRLTTRTSAMLAKARMTDTAEGAEGLVVHIVEYGGGGLDTGRRRGHASSIRSSLRGYISP